MIIWNENDNGIISKTYIDQDVDIETDIVI